MKVDKTQAGEAQFVNVGGLDLAAKGPQVGEAHVVGQDNEEVGSLLGLHHVGARLRLGGT